MYTQVNLYEFQKVLMKDIKEAVECSTTSGERSDKQFYQSGISLDQRIFEPMSVIT